MYDGGAENIYTRPFQPLQALLRQANHIWLRTRVEIPTSSKEKNVGKSTSILLLDSMGSVGKTMYKMLGFEGASLNRSARSDAISKSAKFGAVPPSSNSNDSSKKIDTSVEQCPASPTVRFQQPRA